MWAYSYVQFLCFNKVKQRSGLQCLDSGLTATLKDEKWCVADMFNKSLATWYWHILACLNSNYIHLTQTSEENENVVASYKSNLTSEVEEQSDKFHGTTLNQLMTGVSTGKQWSKIDETFFPFFLFDGPNLKEQK